jgi:hypothetical protein
MLRTSGCLKLGEEVWIGEEAGDSYKLDLDYRPDVGHLVVDSVVVKEILARHTASPNSPAN